VKERWNLSNGVVWNITPMSWKRGKRMVYTKKKWLLWFFQWNWFF